MKIFRVFSQNGFETFVSADTARAAVRAVHRLLSEARPLKAEPFKPEGNLYMLYDDCGDMGLSIMAASSIDAIEDAGYNPHYVGAVSLCTSLCTRLASNS
jgi:hypothetical protein